MLGKNNVGGAGGGSSIELNPIEIGAHKVGFTASRNLKTYVDTTDITSVCTYTPSIFSTVGEQEVNIDFCGKASATKTVTVEYDYNYNFFTYTGNFDFYDAEHKILLLKSSGVFNYSGLDTTAILVGGGNNGSDGSAVAGGAGGQTFSKTIPAQTNAAVTIGAAGANTVAFGYTATAGGGSAGGARRKESDGAAGTAGTAYTLGTVTIQPGGGGGAGGHGYDYRHSGGAGGETGGGTGGRVGYSDYHGKAATFYGSGGGGGAYDYYGSTLYKGNGGAGYQGAIFLYNGNEWFPRTKIGGRIFYVNPDANSATYTFYDQEYNVLTEHTVEGLATACYYYKNGTSTTDKFYIYDTTNGLQTEKTWGYLDTTTGITTDGIGKGKSNTATVLGLGTPESGTIWDYVNTCNANELNGQSDWYIPSNSEQTLLRNTGFVAWYATNDIWASVENAATSASNWNYTTAQTVADTKSNQSGCFVIRSI